MKIFSRLVRLIRINFILMRYNIDEILLGAHWFYPLRLFIYTNPYYWANRNKRTRGERIRLALQSLGPIYVKIGQIMSTRLDIIPADIATELALLQDRVKPFPGEIAKVIVETALQTDVKHVFTKFDLIPLASASIAQVHAATLLTGEEVVIKVLRPKIKTIINRDIDLLSALAKLAERYWYEARHFKPQEIMSEVAQTLYDELDLMREAANASQIRRNFTDSHQLHIPKIYWPFCRDNILTMERIYGIPIHDIDGLKRAGFNLKQVAELGIEIFFTQVFRDSFFHADLHPGNIFIKPTGADNPTYIAVDFGIVGALSREDQRYLAENMLAFFKRDYQRVAELHIACGWLPPDTRIDQFEGAIRAVSEPIFEQPLYKVSFGQLLLRLFQVARRFQVNIQPQLILLQKSLLSIEALSRQLAPDLDLWATATPQIEKWLKQQVGVRAFLRRIKENLPLWSEQLPDVPTFLYEIIKETKRNGEMTRFNHVDQTAITRLQTSNTKLIYFLSGVVVTLAVGACGWWVRFHG